VHRTGNVQSFVGHFDYFPSDTCMYLHFTVAPELRGDQSVFEYFEALVEKILPLLKFYETFYLKTGVVIFLHIWGLGQII
jgi:hypothetical protein